MENFFIEDQFYGDLGDFLVEYNFELDDVERLPDHYQVKVAEAKLDEIFSANEFIEYLINNEDSWADRWEDRFPENPETVFTQIKDAVRKSLDQAKLTELLPKLYYPTGEFYYITKNDLLEYLK